MKRFILRGLTLGSALIFSSHLYAAHTITLHNVTSCEVTNWHYGTGTNAKKNTVPAVDVYSFFYVNDFSSSRTYFGTIPANEAGVAVISDHNPNVSPYMPMFNLGYSPSPGYTQGSASYNSTTIDDFNNWYIFQTRDSDGPSGGALSVLEIYPKNPCAE